MTPELDKAVALAEKHGAVCGIRHATITSGDGIIFTPEELTAMLAERDQQHSEELADKTGVMPAVWRDASNYELCSAEDTREAIATMQAKVEQERRMFDRLNQIAGENERKLEQAQARVAELEKDAADMFWNSDDAERQHSSIEEFLNDEICSGSIEVGAEFTIWQAKKLPSVKIKVTSIDDESCEAEYAIIDAAMKGQQP